MKVPGSNVDGEGNNDRNVTRQAGASTTEMSQRFEEATFSTLDAICRSSEESYDKFMKGFVYLKPDNVQKGPTEDDGPPVEFLEFQRNLKSKTRQTNSSATENIMSKAAEVTITSPSSSTDTAKRPDSDQVLEEEMLGAGTTTKSYLMRSDVTSKPIKVKVGNFVDEEERLDSEEEEVYCPSFSTEHKTSCVNQPDEKEACNKKRNLKDSKASTELPEPESTECSCDVARNQPTGNNEDISGNQLEASEPETSVNSQGKEVEPSELNLRNACPPAQSTETDDLLDLVGQYSSECLSDSEELVYDPSKDMLNFGEVKDDEDMNNRKAVRNMVTETLLEFKVVEGSSQNEVVKQTGREEENISSSMLQEENGCSDDVETFELDMQFDYDNVTLTPKYSAEEMAVIMNVAQTSK